MKWRWYHGVLFYIGIEAVAFGLSRLAKSTSAPGKHVPATQEVDTETASVPTVPAEIVVVESPIQKEDEYFSFYNSLIQPISAPPAPVFLPAWAVNNLLTIAGLLRVLNLAAATPGRRAYLESMGVFYASYVTFTAVFFSLRSPIGGAILTNIGLVAALRCGYIAWFELQDKKVVLSLSTLVPWLALAGSTATTIAAWNPDALFNTIPILKPSSRWCKTLVKAPEERVDAGNPRDELGGKP